MPDDEIEGKKKIIIDEDWKSRVEAEKEADRPKQEPRQARQQPESEETLPAPTLSFLAGTLYLQGAVALGLLSDPRSDKQPTVRINQARHAIELLSMLQQKTEGNRTSEETEEIQGILHQLRLAFITVTQNAELRT
ncbi:MAG: DUF1844 domain-containing protein [Thermoguttaceae bacterium]|jgi:hypothetical protein